ncbi:calcium ion Hypothetical protein [Nesidiocoris tenuis]|uniref:Cubilin n=1 Tax=Nesidiocoris tenuis TaxID=355587 RepID=A0ABN7ATS1_9HEMI|nr:calcium ion Hypothetical protein [Nesidiocoris tenuis]
MIPKCHCNSNRPSYRSQTNFIFKFFGFSSIFWGVLFNWSITGTQAYDPYSNQPRLESQNGNLLIIGASGANITLKTSSGGQVNINDENINDLINKAKSIFEKFGKFDKDGIGGGEGSSSRAILNAFIAPLSKRLELIEDIVNNRNTSSFPTRNSRNGMRRSIQLLTAKVNRLARDIRLFRILVETDECASDPCQHGGTCLDGFNNFHCLCPDQWEGPTCQKDVDECQRFKNSGLGCQNGAICQNTPGSFSCICADGWYGIHCTKKTHTCQSAGSADLCGHGVCVDQTVGTVANYKCECDQGWTTSPSAGGACTVDIDECAAKIHPCSHDPLVNCINLPGSYRCGVCPRGYEGNGYQCRDIDECLTNNGGCSSNPMVQCINTRGSRVCGPCPPGYVGDGTTCSRTDSLCDVNRGGCHPLATCIHNPGLTYVQCRCPPGYTGSGVGENGCSQDGNGTSIVASHCPPSYCLNGGSCFISIGGTVSCSCLPYYTGSRCESGADVCSTKPCKNGGHCVTITTQGFPIYRCLCEASFTGDQCQYSMLGCGGTYREENGTISWPMKNETESVSTPMTPHTCQWIIASPQADKVLNITANYNISCSTNFLVIHDGRSTEYPATKLCGYKRTMNYTSSWNVVLVIYEFKLTLVNQLATRLRQFTLSWKTVPRTCGGELNVTTHGTLSSPGSPGYYPHNSNCTWLLTAKPGKRIQFTFFLIDIETSYGSCKFDFLKLLDGGDLQSPELAVLCNKTVPPPITTASHIATLHFVTDNVLNGRGWQLAYAPVEGVPGCGGLLNLPRGRIVAPQHHKSAGDTYGNNLNCEWRIAMPGRDRIRLEFSSFRLEFQSDCAYDYLAVYDGPSTDDKLLGRWCGTDGPTKPIISSTNSVTVVFDSDASFNEGGFTIDYSLVCDIEYTDPNGTISSPMYPNPYPVDRICHYLISVPIGNAISFQMIDLDMEHPAPTSDEAICLYDTLTIYDGDTPNSPTLAKLCGNGTKGTIVSTHNYLLLVFQSDESNQGRGFLANYKSIPISCGGIYRGESGTITSPAEVLPGSVCRWVVSADAGKVVELGWSSFFLQRAIMCQRDHIKIYENSTDLTTAHQLGDAYCGEHPPPSMTSSSNILMIVLTTSAYSNAIPRFTAFYRVRSIDESCRGNYFSMSGEIHSPQFPQDYPDGLNCVWTITVPVGKQIKLHFHEFMLEGAAPCRSDYLEIRNGGYPTSPLIGKYCGHIVDEEITSFSNQIYISFFTDAAVTSKGFNLSWDGALTGCGGEIAGYSGSIISPNYPFPYGRNAECIWKVTVSQGSVISLTIVDIDLETHSTCNLDYLELRDGISSRSPLLGRYCTSNHPFAIMSTSNAMFIKFRSDISRSGRGFNIKFNTVCNRTMKGFRGVIESPLFPTPYAMPLNCQWSIEASIGSTFTLVISHLMIVSNKIMSSFCKRPGTERYVFCKAEKNCEDSYLEIGEGPLIGKKSLQKFCGSLPRSTPIVNTTVNRLNINLKVANSNSEALFRLEWSVVGCGGEIKGKSYGDISSPDYPSYVSKPVVCEWTITTTPGTSVSVLVQTIVIDPTAANCDRNSLKIFGGPDSLSPLLTKLCKPQATNAPLVSIQTSGNKALVRFELKDRGNFKFRAVFEEKPSACGGYFSSPSGSIHSVNYPQNYDSYVDCNYDIYISENKRINLTFVDFDIDSDANCSRSYVKVFDGQMDSSAPSYTFCGNAVPKPIISTTSKLIVRHNAGGRTSKGFLANYSPVCGGDIRTDDEGYIEHSEVYDGVTAENCTWTVSAVTLGKKFTLTFTKLDIRPTSTDTTKLVVYSGEDETSPVVYAVNGDVMPYSTEITGSAFTVRLLTVPETKQVNFELHYTLVESACGGTIEADQGVITSPRYPSNYPPNVECVWTISNSPGNTLVFQVDEFHMLSSESCNEEYLEIRETNDGGRLVGAYCGQVTPPRLTSNSSVWVKFKSSSGADKGFTASFSIGYNNDLRGSSGDVKSPRFPALSIRKSVYGYRITVAVGSVVAISLHDAYFYESSKICNDQLTIYDGFDATAPTLKSLCFFDENSNPESYTSAANVVYVVFRATTNPARFALSWRQTRKLRTPEFSVRNQTTNCSQEIHIAKEDSLTFTSPGYPHGYGSSLYCEWIITSDPDTHLKIMFTTIDLETRVFRPSDKITVFDANADGSWKSLDVLYQAKDSLKTFEASSNMMKVTFTTDSTVNKTGFSATAQSACGSIMTEPDGLIQLNRTGYVSQQCTWNITVKPGKRIEVYFVTFNFPVPHESSCNSNYLLLKEGFESDAPLLGEGKYCGSNALNSSQSFTTNSNRLSITTSSSIHLLQEFELMYITRSRTCTSSVHLTPKGLKSLVIRSPNYPNMPPPHSECTWQFFAPNAETIHVDFIERFDIAFSVGCEDEYLELRDGSTEISPLIGRYCYSSPAPFILTEGNALFVKYFTNLPVPNNGFKIKVSLAKCGGTYHDFISGVITSPGYPEDYEPELNCVWRLLLAEDVSFKFTFENFNLGVVPYYMKGVCNNTMVDTLNITALNPRASNNQRSWMLCGKNATVESVFATEIILNFTSLKQSMRGPQSKVPHGFKVQIVTERPKCGGYLNLAKGRITSPGYPSSSQSQYCSWRITAPSGRRVTFNITDFDLEVKQGSFSPNLLIYNDFSFQSRLAQLNGTASSGTVISSTGNKMMLYYSQAYRSSHRGFSGYYSTDQPSLCGPEVRHEPSGQIRVDMPQPFYCDWTLSASNETSRSTTVIKVIGKVDAGNLDPSQCYIASSRLDIHVDSFSMTMEYCSTADKSSPFTFINPLPSTSMVAIADHSSSAKTDVNYTISWKRYPCGGVYNVDDQIVKVLSPTASNNGGRYPPDYDCAWKITYLSGSTIKVEFNSLDIDVTNSAKDCSSDYLAIHNGPWPSSPQLLKICGNTLPEPIITNSNSLFIHFHSDSAYEAKGFDIKVSLATGACGGILHESPGFIESPNYPMQYPNNSNCIYEIRVDAGYHIGLIFTDRFYIEESENCSKDFVEMFDYVNEDWKSLGRVCGRTTPKPFNSTSNRMKVRFNSNNRIEGDGFRATWNLNCGGVYDGTRPGVIRSPRYPEDYTGDLVCNYTVIAPRSLLYGSFDTFDLEPGTDGCKFDKVSIWVRHNSFFRIDRGADNFLGTFCGDQKPPRFVSYNAFTVVFTTDAWTNFKGFLLNYGIDSCGGNITEPSTLRGPQYDSKFGYPRADCFWNITAPAGKLISIKIQELYLTTGPGCGLEYVKIWDGNYLAGNNSNLIASLCGQLKDRSGKYRSTSNNLLVRLYSNYFSKWKKFVADITFVHGPSVGCGGLIEPAEGSKSIIESPDLNKDKKYDTTMDCLWSVSAPPSMSVLLTFEKFDLDQCYPGNKTCSCDFLEVYDGIDENTELIGRFCGSTLPNKITSSGGFLTIKFSSDELVEKSGFRLSLTALRSPCGITYLNVTDQMQTLTSPSYPGLYPSNIHCKWVLVAKMGSFDIHVEEVDIVESKGCQDDSLEIKDVGMGFPYTNGMIGSPNMRRIYIGNDKVSNMRPSLSMGSRFPFSPSTFCGKVKNVDYYSSTNLLMIKFRSSSEQRTAKGFKLSYSLTGCRRNFTGSYGRLNLPRLQNNCVTTVSAPNKNSTLALYFSEMRIFSWNKDASIKLEIYDGSDVNDQNALLLRITGNGARNPEPVFSNSSTVTLVVTPHSSTVSFDITYTSTTMGPGCGGYIFNYGGIFTSTLYPMNVRNYTSCRWDIAVPVGGIVDLEFTVFDIGPKNTCSTDFVRIIDVTSDGDEIIQRTFCGGDNPAKYSSTTGQIAVQYVTSIHNGGTGWVARFMSRTTNPAWPALVGQHLI